MDGQEKGLDVMRDERCAEEDDGDVEERCGESERQDEG